MPILIVGSLSAENRIAVSHPDSRRGAGPRRPSGLRSRGGDVTNTVAGVDIRWGNGVSRDAVVPEVRRLPRGHRGLGVAAVETNLAKPLASVGAPAHAAGVRVEDAVARSNHGLFAHAVGQPDARPGVDVVPLHGSRAIATGRSAAGKLQRPLNATRQRVGDIGIEEG